MRQIPDNYFCPSTEKFIAISEWTVDTGTTGAVGSSDDSLADAIAKSVPEMFVEFFGKPVIVAYERTDETRKIGREIFQVYNKVH